MDRRWAYAKMLDYWDKSFEPKDRLADKGRDTIISPIDFLAGSRVISYLKELGCGHAVRLFDEWNGEVRKAIFNSPEFKAIYNSDLEDFNFREGSIKIARKYAYLALDGKYKKPSDPDIEEVLQPRRWFVETHHAEDELRDRASPAVLKEMIASNPAMEK